MTDVKKEALVLKRVSYIHYPVQFKKNTYGTQVQALINLRSEVNAMTLVYASKLGFKVYSTNIGA